MIKASDLKIERIGDGVHHCYNSEHLDTMCDKCGEVVEVLFPVPFLYCDHNDIMHENLGGGYRQYYCCADCYTNETKQWMDR